MSHAPSYGWCMDTPGQAGFPGPAPSPACNPVGQAYYPSVNQCSDDFRGQHNMTPGFGWQQGPELAPSMGFGGFNSAPAGGVAPDVYGFGFTAPPTQPAPAPPPMASARPPFFPEPSAPPLSVPSPFSDPGRTSAPDNRSSRPFEGTRETMSSAPKVINITSDSKPARPPPPEVVPATNSIPKPSSDLNKPTSSDGEDRRNTSQYKEALQNMAALMTDVDLTEDVMNDLKHRFDLK
ncbi:hypothetical protein D915_010086 [Fasciola hepatica]|uniref:Uncharacterized protein n=1 Tax=Fasciola hepatica TaxID=6192 RepID=A0A4E0QUQ8_FASHE|nr:hypothetical protein D915_010086 [Fasciola hepatica]